MLQENPLSSPPPPSLSLSRLLFVFFSLDSPYRERMKRKKKTGRYPFLFLFHCPVTPTRASILRLRRSLCVKAAPARGLIRRRRNVVPNPRGKTEAERFAKLPDFFRRRNASFRCRAKSC